MSKTKALTIDGLVERLEEEYNEYEREWLQMTPRELINIAGYISTIETGKDYIEFVAEDGKANLKAYEETESILSDFLDFHMDSMDGSITEETIQEFENYLLEGY